MEIKNIVNICTRYIYTAALKRLDVDTVRAVFAVGLATAREKVQGTETPFDDWLIDAVEAMVADDTKMTTLVDWIRNKMANNICESGPEGETQWETLAHEMLYTPGVPQDGTTDIVTLVATLLQTIIPIIVEWWKNREGGAE